MLFIQWIYDRVLIFIVDAFGMRLVKNYVTPILQHIHSTMKNMLSGRLMQFKMREFNMLNRSCAICNLIIDNISHNIILYMFDIYTVYTVIPFIIGYISCVQI